MELLVFGSGHGVPTADRFCSATLLKCGGSYYLVDAGGPVANLLIRNGIPFAQLRAVFLTHRHSDHTVGMAHLVDLASWYFKESSFDSYYPDRGSADGLRQFIISMNDSLDEERLRLHTYEAGVIYSDENITVTAIPTEHMEGKHPSYAFVIDGDGQRVIFTGDLHGGDPYDFPRIAMEAPSDAIICELAHFHVADVLPYIRKCNTRRFFFNHYNENWTDEIVQLQESGELPYPVAMLRDGDKIAF